MNSREIMEKINNELPKCKEKCYGNALTVIGIFTLKEIISDSESKFMKNFQLK